MPEDIEMCDNEECILCLQCYRFMAVPDQEQRYKTFQPVDKWECGYFIELAKFPDDNN